MRHTPTRASGRTGQPVIADNLSKAGWSWGCVLAVDSHGQTIWIADAHRDDGKRFVVRADERLTAFDLSLGSAPLVDTERMTSPAIAEVAAPRIRSFLNGVANSVPTVKQAYRYFLLTNRNATARIRV
jgi:hypothetical protein